jgi:uncharacterized protein (TIGR00106 family)
MAIVQASIVPIGVGTSLSNYLAQALSVLEKQKGLKHQLTPMGTVIEGDLDSVLSVIKQMHESVFGDDVRRVYTVIVIDDRRDKAATMESKVSSVQQKLRAK